MGHSCQIRHIIIQEGERTRTHERIIVQEKDQKGTRQAVVREKA
jgi:hypothetical protein